MAGDVMMSGITVEQFPGTDPDRAGAMTAGRHFIWVRLSSWCCG